MDQSFGGPWTLLKLDILEKYLGFYTQALKKQRFKLCYIDAFAGSGNVDLKNYGTIPGSALRALDYPFDSYFYIEKNQEYLVKLEEHIKQKVTNKKVSIIQGDCNQLLHTINSYDWYSKGWRGVIFLDPYAMELNWDSLSSIAETRVFDVWYLFPISALNRILPKDGDITLSTKQKITRLLGTDEWENQIYFESPQITLFGDVNKERIEYRGIQEYVINRLESIFPAVCRNAKILTLPNRSPLFLLCFAVSNPSSKAIELSMKVVNHLLKD